MSSAATAQLSAIGMMSISAGVERRVMAAIEACRTPTLGGQVEQCGDCGLVRCAYNSCRNRHCPKCQGLARAEWLEARQTELLPVPYFHVVFTMPVPAVDIAFQNKRVVYAILFRPAVCRPTRRAARSAARGSCCRCASCPGGFVRYSLPGRGSLRGG